MEENKITEKKELGTQWLGFLYRFFVLQCFIIVCSILGTFSKIIEHKKYYGSTSEINGFLYFLIFMYIVRLIAKISVFAAKKDKYSPFFLSFMIDFICISLPPYYGNGIMAFFGFLTKFFLAAAIIIPNMVYVTKRKSLLTSVDQLTQTKTQEPQQLTRRNVKCGKCGHIGPYDGNCPECGSTLKFYFDEPIEQPINNNVDDKNTEKEVNEETNNETPSISEDLPTD